jgi:hypothetical protein
MQASWAEDMRQPTDDSVQTMMVLMHKFFTLPLFSSSKLQQQPGPLPRRLAEAFASARLSPSIIVRGMLTVAIIRGVARTVVAMPMVALIVVGDRVSGEPCRSGTKDCGARFDNGARSPIRVVGGGAAHAHGGHEARQDGNLAGSHYGMLVLHIGDFDLELSQPTVCH